MYTEPLQPQSGVEVVNQEATDYRLPIFVATYMHDLSATVLWLPQTTMQINVVRRHLGFG